MNDTRTYVKRKCRDCNADIYLTKSLKTNRWYPCNSEKANDFHRCRDKTENKTENKKEEAQFGDNTVRQLDLDFSTEVKDTTTGYVAIVTFNKAASMADVKGILARLGDDVASTQIVKAVN